MIYELSPSYLEGKLSAYGSKSYMQRAIVAAFLSQGISYIKDPIFAKDCKDCLQIIYQLGSKISFKSDILKIWGSLHFPYFVDRKDKIKINCGESGLAMRLFTPIVAQTGRYFQINGKKTLLNRISPMIQPVFNQLGVFFESRSESLPFYIQGPFSKKSHISTDGSLSSQFLSGLLFSLPFSETDTTIEVVNLQSKPYIDITLDVLQKFGIIIENHKYQNFFVKGGQTYKASQLTIEGDWSGASFILVGAAIQGNISMSGLDIKSLQADKAILCCLKLANAKLMIDNNIIKVHQSELLGFEYDCSDCPDLVPILVTLGAYCRGKTILRGVTRLFNKESNRINSIISEFRKLGVKVSFDKDKLIIEESIIQGGTVDSCRDHRVAMALSILALRARDTVRIINFEVVEKSYPRFKQDLEYLQKNKKF